MPLLVSTFFWSNRSILLRQGSLRRCAGQAGETGWSVGRAGTNRHVEELKMIGQWGFNIFLSDPFGLQDPDQYSSTPILQHSLAKSSRRNPAS
jgi:hypothetical protein